MDISWNWLIVALAALSACGGGGGGKGTNAEDALFILPTPASMPQTNGLAYASQSTVLADAVQVPVEAITVMAILSDNVGTAPQTITLGPDFFDGAPEDLDAVLQYFDQEVTVTNGEGILANGQTLRLFYDPSLAGDYAGLVGAATYASLTVPPPADAFDAEAQMIVGHLTDPAEIDRRIAGQVTFLGDVHGAGRALVNGVTAGSALGVALDGTMALTVDFVDDYIAGELDASYAIDSEHIDVDLTLDPTHFSGNTFAGALVCRASNCDSTTTLDGAFYGPLGTEVGGVLAIDLTQRVDGESHHYQGAVGFVGALDDADSPLPGGG